MRQVYISTLRLRDDDFFVFLAAMNKPVLQITRVADQASGEVVHIWEEWLAINNNGKHIVGPKHPELANEYRALNIDSLVMMRVA